MKSKDQTKSESICAEPNPVLPPLVSIADLQQRRISNSSCASSSNLQNVGKSDSVDGSLMVNPSSLDLANSSNNRPGTHFSMFDPPPVNLGKRKRTIHDYSMLLKGPFRVSGRDESAFLNNDSSEVTQPTRKRRKVCISLPSSNESNPNSPNLSEDKNTLTTKTGNVNSFKTKTNLKNSSVTTPESVSYKSKDVPELENFKGPSPNDPLVSPSAATDNAVGETTSSTTISQTLTQVSSSGTEDKDASSEMPCKRLRKPSFRRIIADQSNEYFHSDKRKSSVSFQLSFYYSPSTCKHTFIQMNF